nr:GrBNV gp19-like protein [Apis mellifera nudivirus]
MKYTTVFIFLFTLVVLGLLIYIVLRPAPLKPLIRLALASPTYELNRTHVISSDNTHILYGSSQTERLAILLIGGAFLFNDFTSHFGMSNTLADLLIGQKINLLMLRYPVRFTNTVYDAMISINNSLRVHATRYKQCYMIGFSAGALLAGVFIRKEQSRALANLIKVPQIGISARAFVGICGLYDVNFDNDIISKLFGFYIMKNTPEYKRYHCRDLTIPTFLISSTNDILIGQTRQFVETQQCTYKLFNEKLPHAFIQYINLPQSQEALKLISEFVIAVVVVVG